MFIGPKHVDTVIPSRDTWLHAGKPASPKHLDISRDEQVTLDGQPYWVRGQHDGRGYYVPYYDSASKTKRGAVLEQKKRMFYFSERNIDVVDSHEDIMADYKKWQDNSANIERHKYSSAANKHQDVRKNQRLGALVVGAMINRTARVEQAILMQRAEGLSLEDVVPNGPLDAEHLAALKAELGTYAQVLFKDKSLVKCVRREDYSVDRNGLLEDIIYETLKAYAQNPEMVSVNTVDKIGGAMFAIDETADITRSVLRSLYQHPNLKGFMQEHGAHFLNSFDGFVETARARAGIKSSDVSYSDIHGEFTDKGTETFDTLREMREAARDYKGRAADTLLKGLKLVSTGARLIDDMPQARYPMNKLAFASKPRAEGEKSSVEDFADKVQTFMNRRGASRV